MSDMREPLTVHFQQDNWSMIQGSDGLIRILDHGTPVEGCSWPISSLHRAVARFRVLAGSTPATSRKRVTV